MSPISRRHFLSDSMIASAGLALGSGFVSQAVKAAATEKSVSANDKLNVMICGVNGRGEILAGLFAQNRNCKVKYICDVDEAIGQRKIDTFEKRFGYRPQFVRDMRRGLDDKDLEAAVVATPNHWHALVGIWAMQADKDVYLEKPVSHNISEGRRLIETARKYKKICQTGTQSRSLQDTIDAIDYVQSGNLGTVKLARALCYRDRKSIGKKGVFTPPKSVDYHLWVGPAEMQPVTRPHFHYDWHWQYHWGNGDINNLGVHLMDIARWGLKIDSLCDSVISYGGRLGYIDAGETANTQVSIYKSGDKTLVHEVRGLKTDPLQKAMIGNIFYGSDGVVVLNDWGRGFAMDLQGEVVKRFSKGDRAIKGFNAGAGHVQNFVDAVKGRNPKVLNAEVREGHLSAGFGHVGTISYRLGKESTIAQIKKTIEAFGGTDENMDTLQRTIAHLKDNGVDLTKTPMTLGAMLKMDAETETFTNHREANHMLTRQYRKAFEVPSAGKV